MSARFSLRARIVALVAVAIVPLFGMSIYKALHNADATLKSAKSNLQFAASLAAAGQDGVADSAHHLLTVIASLPEIQDSNNLGCDRYFSNLTRLLPEYANLGVVGLDGYARCHALGSEKKAYLGDRAYFLKALQQRRFVVGDYAHGRLAGKPVITFAQPVMDAANEVTGVVFASIDLAEMAKQVGDLQLPAGVAVGIHDSNGTFLAGKPVLPVLVGQMPRSPVLREAIKTWSTGVGEGVDGAGQERLWAYMPSSPHAEAAVFVAVSADRDLVLGPVQRQLWLELALLALVAFLGGWVAWMMGGRAIVGPATQLLEATRQLRDGQRDFRIPISTQDDDGEFARIARDFNLMAESLEQRGQALDKELEKNRQAYGTLALTLNSMQEGMIAVDASGRLLLINETAKQIFSAGPDDNILSSRWATEQGFFIPGTDMPFRAPDLPLARALKGESGGPAYVLIRNARKPDGCLLSCQFAPMRRGDEIVGVLTVFADISDMDRMQREQTESLSRLWEIQRKLADAQSLGRIGFWEYDIQANKLWVSAEVNELFDVAPGTFEKNAQAYRDFMHPDDRVLYLQRRELAFAQGLPIDFEYRIVTPGGETRWIHQFDRLDSADDGQPLYRIGIVQEITERKRAELLLSRSSELLRRTGQLAKVGGWELSLDNFTSYWSEEVYRIFELEPATAIDFKKGLDFYAPDARATITGAVHAARQHGTPWDLDLPMLTATGRPLWVRTQGRALYEGDKVVRLVGALQDITVEYESRQQLRLLETSVSRLNDIVLITEAEPFDEPGPRIVFVNDAFVRRTGYSREEVLGQSPRFLQGPNTQRAELDRLAAALKSWQPVRAELINYTKSGEEFWIELDIVPIADAKGCFTHWVAVERDITQRKLAEQALMDSEQRYAALFESAPVPMWIADPRTLEFLAVNEAAVSNYGYSRDEFLHLTIVDILSRAERERLKQYLAQGLSGAAVRWLHVHRDGSEFPVQTVSRAISYLGREVRFVVAINIAAQVKAEKGVQDHLFMLERAADATQAITRHRTLEATLQETVEQARAVVGAHLAVVSLTLSDEPRRALHAVSHSDKYANARDFVRLAHDSGLYSAVSESNSPMRLTQAELEADPRWTGLGADAGKVPLMRGWLAVPLTGHGGENIGLLQLSDKCEGEFTLQDKYVTVELAQLVCIAIENTKLFEQVQQLNQDLEEKVAERTAALARQEALFRALAEQAPQVVWNADSEGRLTYLNRKWYELVGGSPADWMGNKWRRSIHPDDLADLTANWESSSRSLKPYEGMRRLLARDGTYHTMSYRASPVLDENGTVLFWVGIDADVTEIKAIESALRLSNQELEAFSYSVSHDLRSPLNTVDGFSRLLAKQLDAGTPNEKIRHYLSRIQAGVAQMGQLIEDLLSLAQVSRMQLSYETVDLSAMAREIADECRGRNPERAASISVENGLLAQGDGRLVRVVMENLLGNAWKFSSGQSRADIRVGHTTDAAGVTVFFVQDNGAGFDMAFADKLFQTFQRLHGVTEFPGSGVGLATVSRVIGRHGGRVWAQSEPGKGAIFYFTLPGVAVTV